MWVCSFLISSVCCFFTLGTRLHISKFCVDLCKKKSDRLKVSILEYNINWNSKRKRFGFLKEEQNSVVIHW